ncbi:ABC transporter substrate-binding protein [Microbacterium keratanolyticum]|uniref:ABC transporter substrate-binding protein n=1 Tax=Microbacterium keratanolyticum TaxID=67574 RepID=UPI003627CBCA
MKSSTRLTRAALAASVIAASAALVLSGCSAPAPAEAGSNAEGDAVTGGILRVAGGSDIGGFDPIVTRSTGIFAHRALTRQLYILPTDDDKTVAQTPMADLATDAPEISADGTEYRIVLRDDAQWDTEPARAITAEDAARGFKRLCNPVRPGGSLDNYIGVIKGMTEYCEAFANVAPEVGAIQDFVESTDIEGVVADGQELTITLENPSNDFSYVLTQLAVAPVPEEILGYLPDSPELRENYIASGPYRIAAYVPDQKLTLERNPAWTIESDPYRKAYIDGIEIAMNNTDPGRVQRLIETGEADSYFDQSVPTADLQRLMATKDPQLVQFEDGAVNPYILLNLQSPNNGGALADLKVRQAINYAVNKIAVAQVGGGPDVKQPHHQLLSSAVDGYEPFNLYKTPGDEGDAEKAKKLLAEAGYPDGIDLNFVYASGSRYDSYAQALEPDLRAAGIRLNLMPTPGANVDGQYVLNRDATAAGSWDITLKALSPKWIGNGARTMIMPGFYGVDCEASTTNPTCYDNDEVNALMEKARGEQDAAAAAKIWAQVDRKIMEDAAIVPLISGKISLYHSKRLHGGAINLGFNNIEPGLVWLED